MQLSTRRTALSANLLLLTLPITLARALENNPVLIVEAVSSDSPAAKAGLKPADRLISFDGKPLPSPAAFDALQQNTFGKQNVVLQIRRGAEPLSLTVPLGPLGIETRPELPPAAAKLYKEGKLALAAKSTADPWLYNRLGETLETQRQWKQATDAHLSAWNLLQNSADPAAKSRTLLALGTCSLNQSDFAAATKWYEQARQLDLAAGNEIWLAAELQGLGVVAYDRGDLATARDYFQRDLAIPQRLAPHSLDMASSLNWLAKVARKVGDLPSAEDYFQRALAVAEPLAPISRELADSLNGLGIIAAIRGDTLVAQGFMSRALAIREQLEPISLDVAGSLSNLSLVAMTRGDNKAAQNYLSRALRINEELAPESLSVATTLINLGQNARNLGDLEAAEKYQKRALAIEERLAPDSLALADSLRNLGDVAIQRHNLAAAEDYENRALAIQEHLAPNSLDATDSLHSLCHIALERDDRPAAQKICQRALHSYEQFAPDSVQVAGVLNKLGSLAMREHHFPEARTYFTRSVNVLESQRGRIPSAEARDLLVAEYQPEYEGLVQSLLALNDVPAAFSASEQARTRSLLDLLTKRTSISAKASIRRFSNGNSICGNRSTLKRKAKRIFSAENTMSKKLR